MTLIHSGWRALVSSTVVLIAALVIVGALTIGRQPAASRADVVQAAATASNAPVNATQRVPLPGVAYDLAYDRTRKALWFAVMGGGRAALYEYDLQSGGLKNWPLPPTDHNGFLEHVVVGPDGAIWVTEDYSVVRFDPDTASSKVRTFEEADPNAVESVYSPGTWPSGLAFDSHGVPIVARHNIPVLTELGPSLADLTAIPVSGLTAGPGDVAAVGTTVAVTSYAGQGDTVLLTESGTAISRVPARAARLAVLGQRLASIGPGGLRTVGADGSTPTLSTPSGTPTDLVATTPTMVVAYADGPGTFQRFDAAGKLQATVALEITPLEISNPVEDKAKVLRRDQVTALAVTDNGSTWFVDGTTNELVQMNF